MPAFLNLGMKKSLNTEVTETLRVLRVKA